MKKSKKSSSNAESDEYKSYEDEDGNDKDEDDKDNENNMDEGLNLKIIKLLIPEQRNFLAIDFIMTPNQAKRNRQNC